MAPKSNEAFIDSLFRIDYRIELSPFPCEDGRLARSESVSQISQGQIEISQSPSNSSYTLLNASPQEAELSTQRRQPWLPFYLRRSVFVTFTIVLFAISQKYQGLAETSSSPSYRYSWTYGPTAIFTLVRAFWNRVDYDAKVAAPWLRDDPARISRDALLLDYLDILPPQVILKAFRRRDWLVAATATISLILTTLIVLSTGLFTLMQIEIVDNAVPIILKSQFVENPDRLKSPSDLPVLAVEGLTHANLSYSGGWSNQFAYQTFESTVPGVTELYATVDGMFLGFSCAQANISRVQLAQMFVQYYDDSSSYNFVSDSNFTFEYEDCESVIPFTSDSVIPTGSQSPQIGTVYTRFFVDLIPVEGLSPGHCGSTNLDHKRLVFYSAEIHYRFVSQTETVYQGQSGFMENFEVTHIQSSSIVCDPYYGIESVDVYQNSTGAKSVSRREGTSSRNFSSINAWDVIQSLLNPLDFADPYFFPVEFNETTNTTTGRNTLFILDACGDSCLQFSPPSNTTTLEALLNEYYSKYAAFHFQSLLQPVNISSTATASRTANRLLVRQMGCQLMAGMMVLTMAILVILFKLRPGTMPRPIEPGSMLVAAALVDYPLASTFPRDLGVTDKKTLEMRINNRENDAEADCHSTATKGLIRRRFRARTESMQETSDATESTGNFKLISPLILRPLSRVAVYSLILGCVATLEILLRESVHSQGLGDIQNETYLHYVWTLLPATIFSILALYFSSVDFQTRLLTPHHFLTRAAPIGSSLDLDLLRPLLPRAVYHQIRIKGLAALMTSMATIFSSMFTISIGSLYQSQILPSSSTVVLRTTSTFRTNFTSYEDFGSGISEVQAPSPLLYNNRLDMGPSNDPNSTYDVGLVASLILENYLSYTPLVYENLVFPELSFQGNVKIDVSEADKNSSALISVTVPALRPRLSCRLYSDSDITGTFFYNKTIVDGLTNWTSDGIAINIAEESCLEAAGDHIPDDFDTFPLNSSRSFMTNLPTEGRFAAARNNRTEASSGCSYFLYAWGKFSSFTNPPSISTSVLGCNNTLEIVDVAMSFIGSQLQLDPSHPPQPIESTSRPTSADIIVNGTSYAVGALLTFTLYDSLASLPPYSNDTLLDSFFEQLVTSRYAIPVSSIGDPSQVDAVKDAIIFQHEVIAAQYYSKYFRIRIEEPSAGAMGSMKTVFPSLSNLSTNDTGVYTGTAVHPNARHRLIQDPVPTRIIQCLLLATLTLSLLGWILGPRKAILPRSPTSIASVLALLAGGNVLEYMYKDGERQWETVEDVKSVFPEGCKFWMGWGPPGTIEEETDQRFGIWVIEAKDE
ncbi:hypothetical protein F5Y13DRAFT_200409 [Hypoxylon sp. FL1857]|nr:hypothetical protein F5Y13DRAFT_200409 [Hypoxylon sp. FL1857]